MKIRSLIAVAAAAFVLSSFQLGAQSIVGTWECVSEEGISFLGSDFPMTRYVFNEDGTFTWEAGGAMDINDDPANGQFVAQGRCEGKYKITKNGKYLGRRIIPSSIYIATNNKAANAITKIVMPFAKLSALTTYEFTEIVALTDEILTIMVSVGDSDNEYLVEQTYYRVKDAQ